MKYTTQDVSEIRLVLYKFPCPWEMSFLPIQESPPSSHCENILGLIFQGTEKSMSCVLSLSCFSNNHKDKDKVWKISESPNSYQCKCNTLWTYSFTLRDAVKKNTSYSVTLSLKVGGGQDEIILLGAAKIVTRWVRWGGLRSLSHHFLCYFWQYFDGQNGI